MSGSMLIAYGAEECQEFTLPEPEIMDHRIQLKGKVLGTDRGLTVLLKSDGKRWYLAKGRAYSLLRQEGGERTEALLEDRLLLCLKSMEGGQVFLLSIDCNETYPVMKKYELPGAGRIQIGTDEDSAVNYHFGDYISGKHAQIFKKQNQWRICDSSRNGSWLNGEKITKEVPLKFGDQVIIFGLQIIWLEKYFALGVRFGECELDEKVLRPILYKKEAERPCAETAPDKGPERMYLKRAPKRILTFYTDRVEIEAPPAISQMKKRPVYLTIGPSLTMAVPLLLGYFLTAVGSGNRFYQTAGILTAAASALTGALWAAAG